MVRQITFKRDAETYLFLFPLGREVDVATEILRQADDPSCELDEFDAKCLIHLLNPPSPYGTETEPTACDFARQRDCGPPSDLGRRRLN